MYVKANAAIKEIESLFFLRYVIQSLFFTLCTVLYIVAVSGGGMYVCVYVCVYVCMYVCMYACMYVCMCVYICKGKCGHQGNPIPLLYVMYITFLILWYIINLKKGAWAHQRDPILHYRIDKFFHSLIKKKGKRGHQGDPIPFTERDYDGRESAEEVQGPQNRHVSSKNNQGAQDRNVEFVQKYLNP